MPAENFSETKKQPCIFFYVHRQLLSRLRQSPSDTHFEAASQPLNKVTLSRLLDKKFYSFLKVHYGYDSIAWSRAEVDTMGQGEG